MRKFCCQECGNRIAIPPRHLGRLVCCPECGKMTHPLAEQLVGQQQQKPTTPPPDRGSDGPAPAAARECDNCGRSIGKLETPHVWERNVVCATCHRALSDTAVAPARTATATIPTAAPVQSALAIAEPPPAAVRRPTRVREPRRVVTVVPAPGRLGHESRLARGPSIHLPPGPLRSMVMLLALGLGGYLVFSVVQFISVLINVGIVAALLLLALYLLHRRPAAEGHHEQASSPVADGEPGTDLPVVSTKKR